MITVGADIGNGYSKVDSNVGNFSFRSACEIEQTKGYGNSDYLHVDGVRYAIGKGTGMSNNNKSKDNVYKICLLYALAKLGDTHFKVATGLPISYFKKYARELTETFKGKTFEVILEISSSKTCHRITIEDFMVLPEGLLCVKDTKNKNLLIDIGSHTVDVALFEKGAHVKSDTFTYGVSDLYSKVAKELKRNGSDCTEVDVENYIRNGSYVLDDKQVDFDSKIYRKQQLDLIFGDIKHGFPWSSSTKTFIGGGVTVYQDLLQELGFDVLESTIFDNAKKFRAYGVASWQKV